MLALSLIILIFAVLGSLSNYYDHKNAKGEKPQKKSEILYLFLGLFAGAFTLSVFNGFDNFDDRAFWLACATSFAYGYFARRLLSWFKAKLGF